MSTSALPWRKRSFDEFESPIPVKRFNYYRLESESSPGSADDTESIHSIQDKETDIVRDTSDTRSDSSEYDVDIEYEIETLSEGDDNIIIYDSSGESEGVMYAAAVVGDSSLETFITDAEDSDNSRQGDSSSGLTDFWICIQCKSQNDNPQFRFCDKCFQDRKAFFPPRPRRRKKAERSKEKPHFPVKLDALQSCLKGLSQDSGIGSSQEFGSLGLDQIVIPNIENPSTSLENEGKNRKRQISESSLSDEYEEKRPRKQPKTKDENAEEKLKSKKSGDESDQAKNATSEKSCVVLDEETLPPKSPEADQIKGPLPELKEDCIMCNVKPKNSVFLHGRIAHMCCCYSCAMRTWKSLKRCPICQRKVSNVVRVFTT
ncbi:E3 ubiquitin-protein ligase Mdm2-like [Tribolium madens]|uniref:E3 ubiquitin-protein ligase Mdm2-like n=1 Tax=Tribolium madens TaxID=41895 RepID=UPI001CF76208|nr:E3 ubiquitin-protein ligase Mdm2-like [Tribolium madens]